MTAEVVTLGEALIRYSVPPGSRLESATRIDMGVAGAELNVAVALSRMGRASAWIGALPRNPLGERVHRELALHGVDRSGIVWSAEGRMGTYYIEHARPPRRTEVLYDRADSVTSRLDADQVDWAAVRAAEVVHLSGITPAISQAGAILADRFLTEARAGRTHVVFDVNYRSKLWTREAAAPALADLCRRADTVILGTEDARDLFGATGAATETVRELHDRFECAHVVLTQGAAGSVWTEGREVFEAPAYEVDVVDGIGAGDAFAAGVIVGLLDGDLAAGVRAGTAMAALVLGVEGDLFRFGPDDVAALQSGHRRSVGR